MVALWSHQWLIAVLVAVVPGLVATVVIARVDPRRAVRPLSLWVQLVRIVALAVAVWAAWTHRMPALVLGVVAGGAVLLPWPGVRQANTEETPS